MRKKLIAAILALCCILSGCDFWMGGSYSSVKAHQGSDIQQPQQTQDITDYPSLRDAMEKLVVNGISSGVVYAGNLSQQDLQGFMRMAETYFTQAHPVGCYAVEGISYEIGGNAGRQAIALNISYNRSRSEILRLKQMENMDQACQNIAKALDSCATSAVMIVTEYVDQDLIQWVQNYVDENPQNCMEQPQVTVTTYPEIGTNRVLEVTFTYQTSRDTLRSMQSAVKPIFSSADLYIREDAEPWEKYFQLYGFLMERYHYTIQTSITPSYSLLHHGVGDSKAFAVVYSAMCRQAGLDCSVVGGTKDAEPWWWNAILYEGEYYYVDLLRCAREGELDLRTFQEMVGYVWDYSAYGQSGAPETVAPVTEEPGMTESQEPTEPETPEPTEQEPTKDPEPETPDPEETTVAEL